MIAIKCGLLNLFHVASNSCMHSLERKSKWHPDDSDRKESVQNPGQLGLIHGLLRSPGGGHGNPLQYSHLENPMDRGAWWVAKSWT